MEVTTLGIDIGKNTFHLIGLDQHGHIVLRKKATRSNLVEILANVPVCRIGMEACASAQYWARRLLELGHDVRLMAGQFVKPFVKSQKNDFNDAEAIAEAVSRPTMRFVAVRTQEQIELQALHRARELVVRDYVSLSNQIRAFLLENGIAIKNGRSQLHAALPALLKQSESRLTPRMRTLIEQLLTRMNALREERARFDAQLAVIAREDALCQRLTTIPGIGPLCATALVAAVGKADNFCRARDLAAWIGLVPRQFSTGGKAKLLGLTKHGNLYLRKILVHGARAVASSGKISDPLRAFVARVRARAHVNVAICALANKIARVAWAVLRTDKNFDAKYRHPATNVSNPAT